MQRDGGHFVRWLISRGSQAPAQAQNLADTLAGTDIKVTIGLRKDSESFKDAKAVGFSEEKGTLGEMYDVIKASDFIILLKNKLDNLNF